MQVKIELTLLTLAFATADLEIHLQASKESCQGERAILESFQKQLEQVQRELEMKVHELTDLQERHVHLVSFRPAYTAM